MILTRFFFEGNKDVRIHTNILFYYILRNCIYKQIVTFGSFSFKRVELWFSNLMLKFCYINAFTAFNSCDFMSCITFLKETFHQNKF